MLLLVTSLMSLGSSQTFTATITLPPDQGQPLGTLFELVDSKDTVIAHVVRKEIIPFLVAIVTRYKAQLVSALPHTPMLLRTADHRWYTLLPFYRAYCFIIRSQ